MGRMDSLVEQFVALLETKRKDTGDDSKEQPRQHGRLVRGRPREYI
jgi:hypothetical protein